MIKVNAMGDACPIPVVKTKNAIQALKGPGVVETLVDNEIAVQNLTKMAVRKGYAVESKQLGENRYQVTMTVGQGEEAPIEEETPVECVPCGQKNTVVVISSEQMGVGSQELGQTLLKGFIYALSQQDNLPASILFYNGGVHLTCEASPVLEDLKGMEARGVEILSCGTCLNHYGLVDKLQVGGVTNMYVIVEKMTQAGLIVKP